MAKRSYDPLILLDRIAEVRDVATCGVIRCEVARGLRDRKVLREFQAAWDVMQSVPTDNRFWLQVEEFAWELDRRIGGALPLADIAIACCARRIGAVVLTFDQHFTKIPGIVAVSQIV